MANKTTSISLAEARAIADQWEAQRDDYERIPQADYFRDATPHQVLKMWETGKGVDGRRLKPRERACLVERWVEIFGAYPPGSDHEDETPLIVTRPMASLAFPSDDTTLPSKEVERLLGVSKSTLKRMVADGRFPPPRRTSLRTRGWPAKDVRERLETLDEQRRRPRQ